MLIFGYVILKEKLSFMQIVYIITLLIGLIFVIQPEFIFSSTSSEYTIDFYIGSIFVTITGLASAITNTITRYTRHNDIHWLEFEMVAQTVGLFIIVPITYISLIIYNISANNQWNNHLTFFFQVIMIIIVIKLVFLFYAYLLLV